MLGIETSVETAVDAPEIVTRANRKRLEDAMDRGFAVSQQEAPVDRGTLQQSGYPPTWEHGRLRFGYQARHAKPMEFGTDPYWPPAQPLVEWADRVLGDPGLGYAVQHKIAEQGIDPQPYARPGRKAVEQWLQSHSLDRYLDDEFRR